MTLNVETEDTTLSVKLTSDNGSGRRNQEAIMMALNAETKNAMMMALNTDIEK